MKSLEQLIRESNASDHCIEDNREQMRAFMLLVMEECAVLAENTHIPFMRDDGEALAAEHIRLTARAIQAHR